jgi:DNA-binding CsgD family transcriptional regulator
VSKPLGLLLLDADHRIVFANDEALCALDPDRQDSPKASIESLALGELRKLLTRFADNRIPDEFVYAGCACHAIPLTLPGGTMPEIKIALVIRPLEESPPHATTFGSMFRLTPRETEALELFMLGLGVKETAARMKISPSTAKAFLRMITLKMGVSGRAEMMANLQRYMCPASLTCTFSQHLPVKLSSSPKD